MSFRVINNKNINPGSGESLLETPRDFPVKIPFVLAVNR